MFLVPDTDVAFALATLPSASASAVCITTDRSMSIATVAATSAITTLVHVQTPSTWLRT